MCGHKGEKLKEKNCGLQKESMSAKLQKEIIQSIQRPNLLLSIYHYCQFTVLLPTLSNILKVIFVIIIHCIFKSVFSLKIYYNNFLLFFKF
jgi:hypothetical protein